jgi:Pentapeptide repeats (8 copies)
MSDNPMLVGDMANTSNLQLSPEAEDRLKRLQSAEGKSFTEMVELLGLRPSSSFRGADLRGVDLRGARLAGYDFTGADLAGALMDGADFEGAVVDEHWLATSSEVAATVVPSPTVPVLGVDVQPGNYIIIVGRPGSGKSSFASHLVRYFMTQGGWFATPDANQVLQYRHIMFDWQEQWDRGLFPEATNQRHSPQLRFNVAPTSRNLPTVPVCLLEFSVESFLQLFSVDDKKTRTVISGKPFSES